MGKITGIYLTPHPPIIIEEIGKDQEGKAQATVESMETVSLEIQDKKPDTIVVISPHGPVFSDGIGIRSEAMLKGDFSWFGVPKISMGFHCNQSLIKGIIYEAQKMDVLAIELDDIMCSTYDIDSLLDWGVLVPLYFINQQYSNYKLVTMGISQLPFHQLYAFGIAMKKAIESQDENVIIIASGDLSHRLKEDGPYGYHPAGEKLDKEIVSLIREGDVEGLLKLDPQLIEEGAECGLRSIIMAMGALEGQAFSSKILSYEGPFGVGYCVASFDPGQADNSRLLMDNLLRDKDLEIKKLRENEDAYVRLARQSIEEYIRHGRVKAIDKELPKAMLEDRAGIFVTIKQHGQLRGCIGTMEPARSSIAEEIIHNAISAGTRDPRFLPVEEEELDSLVYSVDVLKKPEAIQSMDQLNVKMYGVIVSCGSRNGLLLPNLEGINNPREQVAIALEKAGIKEDEPYKMKRFEVIRHQ
ncbi:MAG: AmmeMemoRadiSam system protein A [Clostridiales bacterium]|nr:AmmeMemoRadiSam system protein A [Clostridiales bacterium]